MRAVSIQRYQRVPRALESTVKDDVRRLPLSQAPDADDTPGECDLLSGSTGRHWIRKGKSKNLWYCSRASRGCGAYVYICTFLITVLGTRSLHVTLHRDASQLAISGMTVRVRKVSRPEPKGKTKRKQHRKGRMEDSKTSKPDTRTLSCGIKCA